MRVVTIWWRMQLCGHYTTVLRRQGCGTRISSGQSPFHHPCGRPILPELLCHELHVGIDVMKEMLVSRAEVIQPVLASRRLQKAMLGTFAITGEPHIALQTVRRKARRFSIAEAFLLGRIRQRPERLLHQVAEKVVRIDKVIA